MLQSLRVAAISVESKPGETERNIERINVWCGRARQEGAELVLFPELSVTGFIPNHPAADHAAWLQEALLRARRFAEPIPGPSVEALTGVARDSNVLISAGLIEDAGNVLYSTQALVGPQGLLGAWRKLHIPMFEMPFFNGGPAPAVAPTPLGRIGVNLCFDALIPESTRLLAVQNVEIVLFPFAADPPPGTGAAWAEWARPAVRARCVENGVFGVACNYQGRVECAGVQQTFPGGAMVVGPKGEILAEARSESLESGMLLADLRAEALLAARAEPEYLFRYRRPELYRTLAE